MKKVILFATTLLLASLISAPAADIKAAYDKDCAKCHGKDGKGQTKMGKKLKCKDYTDPKVQSAMTDDEMFKAIKEGVKVGGKTKMKAYKKYSDEEIKALVAYCRSFKK
jgi:cytochrome c553